VEESSEIVGAGGCRIVVTTVKKKNPGDGRGDLRFTLEANLGDLTTPASVEPLTLSACKPDKGTLIQVFSRAKPGKTIRTTGSVSLATQATAEQPIHGQEAPPRKSLSFFFPDIDVAKKVARALDRAVAVCGGEEWPDEDDLP